MKERVMLALNAVKQSFPAQPPQWINAVVISILLSALTGVFSFFYGREQIAPTLSQLQNRVTIMEQRINSLAELQTIRYEQLLEELKEIKTAVQTVHPIGGQQ